MKTYKSLLILILFLSFNKISDAQKITQTIRGTIVDKESQIPFPGANIIILGTNPIMGATSDENGAFIIKNVSVGRYNIQVSFMGYEPIIMPEILVSSGKEVLLNFSLQESVTKMNEVVVRAEIRKDKPINSMATVSARTFSVEETRRYAGGLDDPARMASAFAGVSTGNIKDNAIIIRGNAPKGVLWRLEGVEIPNPNHFAGGNIAGGGAVTIFSGQLLSNSDFFTGAFPAEYGNALVGVFDMKLRSGNAETREYSIQLGTLGIDLAAEGPFKKGKKASYLFNYRYSTLALLKYIMPMEQIPVYQDLSFKLNFPTKRAGTFSLWGIGAMDENSEPVEEDSTKWKYEWDRIYYEWYLNIGAIGLNHKIITGKSSYFNTSLVASANSNVMDMRRLNDKAKLGDNFYGNSLTGKYTLTTYFNHKFNAKHTNRTGFIIDYLTYNIDLQSVPHLDPPMIQIVKQQGNTNLVQAYSQSKYNISKKLVMNMGVHAQYFMLNDNYSIEPRFGLRWNANPSHSFSLGYGNHSQLEPLKIYFAQQNNGGTVTYPNKDLDFSKAHHFVLGYDLRITDNLRLKIEPYYQYLYNVPVINDSSYSMINFEQDWAFNEPLTNEGTGENIGLDITIERFLRKGRTFMYAVAF